MSITIKIEILEKYAVTSFGKGDKQTRLKIPTVAKILSSKL